MDSHKQIWGAEGCSSSESGWTMYIDDAPVQDDDAGCSNEYDGYREVYGENRRKKQGNKVDDESDDSMASDASSGPIQYQNTYARGESSHGTAVSKKDKQDHGSKYSSRKNANKQEKKCVDSRSKKR
ncbi:hypothetical protein Lalb_Chr04g0258271 [Lupinus albus]|uniref:Uncharacterized protein n=1 Tax=Lupinus albus TaxID=3870 RepID=A0A6A4QR45_LUPAL|nr:hypothetical protein Lalb_Chr04g0258271 [Lupinus albus]